MIFRFLLCLCFIEFYGVHAKTETEIKELLFREGIACNKDFPVTPEEIIMLKDNKLPDSTNAKCLIACIFKKTGMIDSKGMFDPDNSITMIEKDFADNAEKLATAKKLMEACRGVNEQEVADGEKGCDRAKHLFKCIVDSSAKAGRTDSEIKEWFFREGAACNNEHPITAEEMMMLKENKLPDSPNAKCMVACIFKKTGMMDSKGMYDAATTISMMEKDYADNKEKLENSRKLLESCKNVNDQTVTDGDKGCDRSMFIFKCLTETAAKMGIELP
uniref:Odorant binding protein n=1 Tax=Heliothis virescens TaxID=7102 RepID=A0A2A4K9G9_HELVI